MGAVESVLLVMWVGVKTIVGGPEVIRLTQMCILRGQKRLPVVPKASDQPVNLAVESVLLVAVVAPPIRLLVVNLAVESVLLVMWVGVKTIVGGPEGIRLTQMCILRGQKRLSVVPKASDQ